MHDPLHAAEKTKLRVGLARKFFVARDFVNSSHAEQMLYCKGGNVRVLRVDGFTTSVIVKPSYDTQILRVRYLSMRASS